MEQGMGWGNRNSEGMWKWNEGWDGEMERVRGWGKGKKDGNGKRDGMGKRKEG